MSFNVKFEYKGVIRGVMLFNGMQYEELNGILKSVFSINATIVGFLGEDDTIIPLSLAIRSPEMLAKKIYTVVVSGDGESNNNSLNNSLNVSLNIDDLVKDESKDIEIATGEIFRFISGLKNKNIITETQASLLEANLDESNLLFAAYSVAVSANDARYMANICKDIAQSLETEAGQLACEAQDEVLQICDQLYINNRITENQLLYLRHLVLIREEAVADIYDDFQDKKIDITDMAKALYELANMHPKDSVFKVDNHPSGSAKKKLINSSSYAGNDDEETEEEEYKPVAPKSANKNNNYVPKYSQTYLEEKKARETAANNELSSVVVNMIDTNILSTTEAEILIEMVKDKNEYVMAAFELFLEDENKEELTDTLTRCVKLEVKKRGFMKKMDDLSNKQLAQGLKQSLETDDGDDEDDEEEEEEEEEDDEDDDEEDDEEAYLDDIMMRQGYDYATSLPNTDDEAEKEEDEKIDTEIIMSALGIENKWLRTVPPLFISIVFKAAYRQQITINQAKVACNLFESSHDDIRAVWGVFSLQHDDVDFIDSVGRITRDYELPNSYSSSAATTGTGSGNSSGKVNGTQTTAIAKQKALQLEQQQLQHELDVTENEKRKVLQSRDDAMSAIKDAKKELLKHSLDLMVSTDLMKEEDAIKIYKMTEQPYSLVDSVIDSYAQNKDVAEFMKSLKLLATFVSGELDHLLNKSESELEEMKSGLPSGTYSNNNNTNSNNNNSTSFLPPAPPSNPYTKTKTTAAGTPANTPAGKFSSTNSTTPNVPSSYANKINKRKNDIADTSEETLVKSQQIELSQIILELQKAKVLNDDGTNYLLSLVKSKDQSIMACYKELLAQRNFDEFIEKLLNRCGDQGVYKNNNNSSASDSSPNATTHSLLSPSNQKAVIDILAKADALSAIQVEKVNKLIASNDQSVSRTFAEYETNKDLNALITSLKSLQIPSTKTIYKLSDQKGTERFLNRPTMSSIDKRSDVATMASGDSAYHFEGSSSTDDIIEEEIEEEEDEEDEEDDDEEEDDEEDEEDDDEDEDEDDQGYVEAKFLDIIQDMNLSPLDTSALRLAISRDDNLIKNALESYRLSLNEAALVQSLYEVIQKTILEIKRSDREEFVPDEESDSELVDSPRERKLSSPRAEESHKKPPVFDTSHIVTKAAVPLRQNGTYSNTTTATTVATSSVGGRTQQMRNQYEEDEDDDDDDDSDEDDEGNAYTDDYELQDDDDDDDDEEEDDEEEEEEEEEDEDEDEEDDDDEANQNPSRMVTSQTVRNHIFPILINELVKEGIMSSLDQNKILKLFSEGHHQVNAALDIYDVDHDMSDLVEALSNIVSMNN